MSRTLAPRRPLVAAALFGALGGLSGLTLTATPVRAQSPMTVNFDTLTVTDGSGIRYVDNCYQESGFQVTAFGVACGTHNTFATAGSDDPTLYTGSPALFLNDPTATNAIDFTRVGGGQFGLQSIAFAPFFGANTTITLMGSLLDGSMVSQMFTVPGSLMGVQSFTLGSMFTGLTSARLTASNEFGEQYVQFDDIVYTPAGASTVPEPTTVVLLAGGLLAVGAFARRRTTRTNV